MGFGGPETPDSTNSASLIGPQYGNHFAGFLEILGRQLKLEDEILLVYGNIPANVTPGPSRVTTKQIQLPEVVTPSQKETRHENGIVDTPFARPSKRYSLPLKIFLDGIAEGQVPSELVSGNAFQKHRRNMSLPTNYDRCPEILSAVGRALSLASSGNLCKLNK